MKRTDRVTRAMAKGVSAIAGVFSRYENLLWAGVIAIVIVVQWPVLKGFYYRAAATPIPQSSIEWRSDLDAALDEADRTGKRVLIDVSADWCPPCIAMDHDVWPDPEVELTVARSYVPVRIDADTDTSVMARYRVRGIPAVLIVDARGAVLRRATFLSAAAMVEFLTDASARRADAQGRDGSDAGELERTC